MAEIVLRHFFFNLVRKSRLLIKEVTVLKVNCIILCRKENLETRNCKNLIDVDDKSTVYYNGCLLYFTCSGPMPLK